MCGGTPSGYDDRLSLSGLSPRVRGNLGDRMCEDVRPGSIPACAGEPPAGHHIGNQNSVYPRVCGGTPLRSSRSRSACGLSPRVRGNLLINQISALAERSIPACAGEPPQCRRLRTEHWVYPRVCGGTFHRSGNRFGQSGLSPRVRGNPENLTPRPPPIRSIPACAGEPCPSSTRWYCCAVYPRVCGGTRGGAVGIGGDYGLSPRVRGNPVAVGPGVVVARSIPACAGEPFLDNRQPAQQKVYPRVCGGTKSS